MEYCRRCQKEAAFLDDERKLIKLIYGGKVYLTSYRSPIVLAAALHFTASFKVSRVGIVQFPFSVFSLVCSSALKVMTAPPNAHTR